MNQTRLPLLDYFKKYLQAKIGGAEKLNPSSINNYVSDIKLFLSWIARTLQQPEINAHNITPAIIKAYQAYLVPGLTPATLKRHLSSLRRFGVFLQTTNRLEQDPTKMLEPNLPPPATELTLNQLTIKYTAFLKREQLSNSTIKNYLSDLNAYWQWLKINDSKVNLSFNFTDNNLIKRALN